MKLLNVKETLADVGISRATLNRLVKEGLPYTVVGVRTKMFDPDEVRDFIANRRNELQCSLEIGKEYTNEELANLFSISTQGGMRKSNSKNALVLISFHAGNERLYEDYWREGKLYYTGMGQAGDQDIEYAQNKTLNESRGTSIVIYLFEMFHEHLYRYRGIVKLCDDPFQKEEVGSDGNLRKVWKFPLEVISPIDYLPEDLVEETQEAYEKTLGDLDDKTLREKAMAASEEAVVSNMIVLSKRYVRDQKIAKYAKRRAKGVCQLCRQPAPFEAKGEPYLEEHHVVWLADGGLDKLDNVCALCPNCHRKMHKLNLQEDREKIFKRMAEDEAKMV